MKNSKPDESIADTDSMKSDASAKGIRPYYRPKVLSAEDLEAAAAACDPPASPFGKTGPPTCTTSGS